ncbi:formin-like protein 18 [Tachyglossus aculeatus]|uniref:formin-like protein 18 n=1 Tax=Tachyglossus aculeatus TaxID=9261 RepID=UPI0018F749BB|nr:formin-like protein 18 [Tachyglossus aculeatus]
MQTAPRAAAERSPLGPRGHRGGHRGGHRDGEGFVGGGGGGGGGGEPSLPPARLPIPRPPRSRPVLPAEGEGQGTPPGLGPIPLSGHLGGGAASAPPIGQGASAAPPPRPPGGAVTPRAGRRARYCHGDGMRATAARGAEPGEHPPRASAPALLSSDRPAGWKPPATARQGEILQSMMALLGQLPEGIEDKMIPKMEVGQLLSGQLSLSGLLRCGRPELFPNI